MLSTTWRRGRTVGRVLVTAVLTLGITGCQPAGDPAVLEEPDAAGDEVAAPPPLPSTLAGLLAETDAVAAEWQKATRVVEALVDLTPELEPARARVTYLAAEADRFLTVEVGEQGPTQERPTLATLGIDAIDADGVAAIPSLPPQAQEADALADAAVPVLEACGFDTAVETVLYASGAPAGWDGDRWADDPEWTAIARSSGGGAVALDPVDATPDADPCVGAPEDA